MKNKIIITALILSASISLQAQKSYSIAKQNGKLILNDIGNVSIEGYDGKEIIFTTNVSSKTKTDPRAEGLSEMGKNGYENTGIGLTVNEKNNNVYVTAHNDDIKYNIKVPRQVAISVYQKSNMSSSTISLNNLNSEVVVDAKQNNIKFNDLSGPISLKTTFGNIEGKLPTKFKEPISIVSLDGFIDLSLSSNTKADLSISNVEGALYADKKLNLIADKNEENKIETGKIEVTLLNDSTKTITINQNPKVKSIFPQVNMLKGEVIVQGKGSTTIPSPPSVDLKEIKPEQIKTIKVVKGYAIGNKFNGTMNGGGGKIILKTNFGKIYLRSN